MHNPASGEPTEPSPTVDTRSGFAQVRAKIRDLGGVRHLVDGAAPILGYLAGYQWNGILTGIAAAVAIAAIVAAIRLRHHDRPVVVAASSALVLIFSAMAAATGEGRDFFLPPLILYTALSIVFGVSLFTSTPLTLPICRKIRFEPADIADPGARVRLHRQVTVAWIVFCLAHLVVMGPIYLADNVVLLGTVALIFNKPMLIAAFAGTWVWVRRAPARLPEVGGIPSTTTYFATKEYELVNLSAATIAWRDQGHHVTVGDLQVFVQTRGHRDRPTVILIHGFPTSGFDWRDTMDLLADDFHCVAMDLPGFGLSDKPAAYSYSLFQQADTVEAVARALGIEAAHVVSHDMGTSLHTELLARKHRSALGFTLLTSTFLNGSILKTHAVLTDFQRMLETPSRLPEAAEMCAGLLPQYVAGLQQLMARPEAVTDEDALVMTELMAHHDGHRRLPNVYAYVRERYLHQQRWLDALTTESVAAPVQLVWAADDPVAVIGMGRALSELAPQARFTEVPGVGHFLAIESPGSIAEAVRSITAETGVLR